MESTIKFNINLNNANQHQNNTSADTIVSPLAPNAGIFGGSAVGAIDSSIILTALVAALIGVFLIFKFFRHKKSQGTILFKVFIVTILSLFSLGGSLSLVKALEKTINLDANILDTEKIAYIKDTITIPDATPKGFTLSIHHDSLNPSDKLVNKTDATQFLTSTTGTKDHPVTLANKTYGIALTDPANNNNPVWFAPTADDTTSAYSITDPTPANYKIDIYYGVKANGLKAGIYSGSFKYKIKLNPNTIPRTIFSINTMQDITTELCNNTPTPLSTATAITNVYTTDTNKVPETTLTDTRDNKTYVVRKLADGNCWMSQNLALSTTSGQVLTDADTDINGGRTFTAPGASVEGDSWDKDGSDGSHYLKPKVGYEFYNNGITPSSTGSPTESAGNYYDWNMATAGARDTNGNSLTWASSGEAADSICPKGWRLPPNQGEKSYKKLLVDYHLIADNLNYSNSATTVLGPPFSYVRAMKYDIYNKKFYVVPNEGNMWTSSILYQGTATQINFESTRVFPHYNFFRGSGFSVRCVAR